MKLGKKEDGGLIGTKGDKGLVKGEGIFGNQRPYYLVSKAQEVKELTASIFHTLPYPVLGVDCEGLSKGRPLCLL